MLRSILGVIVGCIVGGTLAFLIEIPGMLMHPLPPGTSMSDMDAIKRHMANAPMVALLGVALAWTVAPLVASWLACIIARRAFFVHALVVAIFFLAMDMMNVFSFPHPAWLMIVGVVAPWVASWLGASLAARMMPPAASGLQAYDMRKKNMAC